MRKTTPKRLDDLLAGIEQILEKNRCSLTEEETKVLIDCMETIQSFKNEVEEGKLDWVLILQIARLISSFLGNHHFKDPF